jgi:hypothetical protein
VRHGALFELHVPRHYAVCVAQDIARFDDRHEFLGETDFSLQAGPDLGVGEDGSGGGGVDGGCVCEIEFDHCCGGGYMGGVADPMDWVDWDSGWRLLLMCC